MGTDGLDNFSKVFDDAGVSGLVQTLKDKKDWEIVYSGAGSDPKNQRKQARKMGVKRFRNYRKTPKGVENAFKISNKQITRALKTSVNNHKRRNTQIQMMNRLKSRGPAPKGYGESVEDFM